VLVRFIVVAFILQLDHLILRLRVFILGLFLLR
jgi:hypothetical protein